jgi:hypothetical protein
LNEFALGRLAITLIQPVDDDYKRMYDINATASSESIKWLYNQFTELSLKRLVKDGWIVSEDFSDEMIVSSMVNSKPIRNGRDHTDGLIVATRMREEECRSQSLVSLTVFSKILRHCRLANAGKSFQPY